jgi:hypothetical protein
MAAEQDPMQREFQDVQERWRRAIDAHRMAPPDAGFSGRLHDLSEACAAEADVCRRAAAAGWAWPPAKTAGTQPYELQPDTGRRGPERLWRRFDAAVSVLTRAAATTDLIAVADAYELLAESVADLADAVEQQDRASGLLPAAARRQSRTA